MRITQGELELTDMAAGQWGLFTMSQARRLGFTVQQVARLNESGAVERLHHGIYRVAGAPRGQDEDLRVAWMNLQPTLTVEEHLEGDHLEVVSHRSAARLHDLGDVQADLHEFTTHTRRQTRRTDIRFHRGDLNDEEWTVVDGLPVTTVPTTIRDLAANHLDGGHLADIVRDALTTRHADLNEVIRALQPHAHRYGEEPGDGENFLNRLLADAGIPKNTQEIARRAGADIHVTTVDDILVALEKKPSTFSVSDLQKLNERIRITLARCTAEAEPAEAPGKLNPAIKDI